MKSSVTVCFKQDDVLIIDFEKDNEMVTLYWGDMKIYLHCNELKHLSERIESFLKEREDVAPKG